MTYPSSLPVSPKYEISSQVHRAAYYSVDGPSRSTGLVSVVFGGFEICDPAYEINRSGYPLHCLEVVVRGSGRLWLGGEWHPLKTGTAFLYGPGIPCRILTDAGNPLQKYFVAFGIPPKEGEGNSPAPEPGIFASAPDDEILILAEMLFREGREGRPRAGELADRLLDILLLRLDRSRDSDRHRGGRAWTVFQQCRALIDERFAELRGLADLAKAANLDPAYISRLFKRYHHSTPYQYLQRRKMDHALHLLRTVGCSVTEAAADIGFNDPFHFSRVFRRQHGAPPSHFRRGAPGQGA